MISEEIPILAADGTGPDKVLAHIHCVLGLDDLGPIASRTVQPEAPQEIQVGTRQRCDNGVIKANIVIFN